jgi:chromosome segregation ATPase
MESQSLPTQEPRHPLVAAESPQTQEPSQSQPDQSSIHDLAVRFVQSVQEGTAIQGLHLTEPQYREVQKYLAQMKERQEIAPDTYTKARKKAYHISDKRREAKKRYNTSDKGREAHKRYNISEKRRETNKRYKTSDKRKESNKRYETSDKGKGNQKRYYYKLKDPRQQKARLEHKIHRENEEYRRKMQELDQQLQKGSATWPLPRPELEHWLEKKQQLEEEGKTLRERHAQALQRVDALVQCYNELSALVEAFSSSPHQQALGSMPPEHAWVLEEDLLDEAFETSERFQEIHNDLRSLLESTPSVSHPQELRPTESAAIQPSAFENLRTDYDHVYEQLEVYLQEFAAPESWLLRNTLDF